MCIYRISLQNQVLWMFFGHYDNLWSELQCDKFIFSRSYKSNDSLCDLHIIRKKTYTSLFIRNIKFLNDPTKMHSYITLWRIICKVLKPFIWNFYNIQLLNDHTKTWIIYERFKAAKLRKRPSHYVESKISIKATLCGEPKAASIQFIFY